MVRNTNISVVFKTPYISLKSIKVPGGEDYVFAHEERCDGKIVCVLPYRVFSGNIQYLIREEFNPCWGLSNKHLSSVSGGVDFGETPLQAVVRELKEETGYSVVEKDLIYLKWIRGSKGADTYYFLYSVDLTNKIKGEVSGDGSINERLSRNIWANNIEMAVDPMTYVMFHRLENKFKKV